MFVNELAFAISQAKMRARRGEPEPAPPVVAIGEEMNETRRVQRLLRAA